MTLAKKSTSLWIMMPLVHVSMNVQRCIVWTTWWSWTIMDCSFTSIAGILVPSMMSRSYVNQICKNTNINFCTYKWVFWLLLGDQVYMGKEMFMMQCLGRHEFIIRNDLNVMHAWYKMKVEWGIERLKQKWGKIIKHFDFTKKKYSHLFQDANIFINFVHRPHIQSHWGPNIIIPT